MTRVLNVFKKSVAQFFASLYNVITVEWAATHRSHNNFDPGLVVTRVGCHTANIVFAGWRYPVGIYT